MSADETPPPSSPSPSGAPRRRRRRGRRSHGGPERAPVPSATPDAPPSGEGNGGATPAPTAPSLPRLGEGRGGLRKPGAAPEEPRGGGPRDGDRRGRRRGRGRSGPGRDAAGRDERRPTPPPPPVVPAVSHLAEAGVASEPLRDDEVAEMKEHLAFLREYKDGLRLRLNAAEDLLVNGRREPSDRGVCRHLLGKVDRAVIEAAVGREPLKSNAPARARMLAGAIRLTADVGVLLAYLETLAVSRSHGEAAQAFAEVVRRIDFESLSPPRLARLLQVLTETFEGQERVQVLFSLLDGPAFRRAFDAAESVLPPEVAAVFAPLRAVHRRLLAEPTDAAASGGDLDSPAAASDRLAVGLEQVMAAPDPVLRGYAEPLRIRMLELALDPGIPSALADRAAGVLLSSLARAGKTYTQLAMRRAAQLLARHVDDRARAVLADLRRTAPGLHVAERWLTALDAKHIGRIALSGAVPERGRLLPGFWLDGQRPVWLRTAPAAASDAVAAESALQASLALPGVASVVEHGVASGMPYVALVAAGQPLIVEGEHRRDAAAALALAAQAARILRALALAGVALPDAEPERFCVTSERTPSLTLADLDGARSVATDEAATTNGAAAVALARRLVPPAQLPTIASDDLIALVQALDQAILHTRRDG